MLSNFICSHVHVFSQSEYDIGRTSIIPHCTDTGDSSPHFEQLWRHPTTQLPVIDEHVQHMLEHDVIEPAASPWCSNVVMVRKQDGTMRLCVDYHKLNCLTVKDKFPLPKIDTCLDTLNGCEFFSTCDLRWGYWQTEIDERDCDKTAFVTRKGQWRFKVLSFGLANAPSQFARIMELVMSCLTYDACLLYLDDILIFSKTSDEHLECLVTVFDRFDRYGLKLKPSKCSLFQRKVPFLGHVVSGHGIECDPDKVASIAMWPTPSNTAEVRTFCGLASYYRTFVCNFAAIARPPHNLTKKGAVFEWTSECENAFQQLKHALTSAPILVAPCDEGQYVLDTDASDTALGAVLQQEQSGKLHVIGYASRTLTPAKARYCITHCELLGVVFGLKKYRQHLLGCPIIVRTDHAALAYLMKMPEPVGQQGRWLDLLGEYDITIQHRPDRVHGNSDALSRCPCERSSEMDCQQCPKATLTTVAVPISYEALSADSSMALPAPLRFPPRHTQAERSPDLILSTGLSDNASDFLEVPVFLVSPSDATHALPTNDATARTHVCGVTAEPASLSLEDIREAQAADDSLQPVIQALTDGVKPPHESLRDYPEEARILFAQWD